MAAQCEVNNAATMLHQQQQQQISTFVSSNAYYGYVPARLQDEPNGNVVHFPAEPAMGMDVDCDPKQQRQQFLDQSRCFGSRKRAIPNLEASIMPRFKRFREEILIMIESLTKHFTSYGLQHRGSFNEEIHNAIRARIDKSSGFAFRGRDNKRLFHGAGDYLWAEEYGLAQMYHESPLLRLSPAADFDMACQPTVMTGNLKFQSAPVSRNSNARCQELEDMLLLTHGCSSYHHYWQTLLSQTSESKEAEF